MSKSENGSVEDSNEGQSPMKANILEQTGRIAEILTDARKFKKYYDELVNNIINAKEDGETVGNKLVELFDEIHSHLP